jgi:hypothetical protein
MQRWDYSIEQVQWRNRCTRSGMFNLTIVDHIRLSFGNVAQNYTRHARAADRLTRLALNARVAILVLLGISVGLSVAIALGAGRTVELALVVVLSLAFVSYAIVASLGVEDRLLGHRYLANRLWLLCEQYRALLAEVQDGLLDRNAILARRDALVQQFGDIDEQGLAAQSVSSGGRGRAQSPARALTEEQIDQYLPLTLRKTGQPDAETQTSH